MRLFVAVTLGEAIETAATQALHALSTLAPRARGACTPGALHLGRWRLRRASPSPGALGGRGRKYGRAGRAPSGRGGGVETPGLRARAPRVRGPPHARAREKPWRRPGTRGVRPSAPSGALGHGAGGPARALREPGRALPSPRRGPAKRVLSAVAPGVQKPHPRAECRAGKDWKFHGLEDARTALDVADGPHRGRRAAPTGAEDGGPGLPHLALPAAAGHPRGDGQSAVTRGVGGGDALGSVRGGGGATRATGALRAVEGPGSEGAAPRDAARTDRKSGV